MIDRELVCIGVSKLNIFKIGAGGGGGSPNPNGFKLLFFGGGGGITLSFVTRTALSHWSNGCVAL